CRRFCPRLQRMPLGTVRWKRMIRAHEAWARRQYQLPPRPRRVHHELPESDCVPRGVPERMKLVLDAIVAYKAAHDGCSPTIREITEATDISSTSLVKGYLERLEEAGKIRLSGEHGTSRGIEVVGAQWIYERGD